MILLQIALSLLFASRFQCAATSPHEVIDNYFEPLYHTLQPNRVIDLFETIAAAKDKTLNATTDVIFELPDGTSVEFEIQHTKLPSLESYHASLPIFLFDGTSKSGPGLLKGEVINLHGGYSQESGLGVSFQSSMRGSMYIDPVWPEDDSFEEGKSKYKSYNRVYALRVVDHTNYRRLTSDTNSHTRRMPSSKHEIHKTLVDDTNTSTTGSNLRNTKTSPISNRNSAATCTDENYASLGKFTLFNADLQCKSDMNNAACSFSFGSCCGPFSQSCTGSVDDPTCKCVDPAYNVMHLKKYRILLTSTPHLVHFMGKDPTSVLFHLIEQIHRANMVLVKELGVVLEVVRESDLFSGTATGAPTLNFTNFDDFIQTDPTVINIESSLGSMNKTNELFDLIVGTWVASIPEILDSDLYNFAFSRVCETQSYTLPVVGNNTSVDTNTTSNVTNQFIEGKTLLPIPYNVLNGGRTFVRSLLLAVGTSLNIGLPTYGCHELFPGGLLEYSFYYFKQRNGMLEKGTGFSAMAMPHDLCLAQPQPGVLYDTIYNSRAMDAIQRNKENPFQGGRCGTIIDSYPRPEVSAKFNYPDRNNNVCKVPIETAFRLYAVTAPIQPRKLSYGWELVDTEFQGQFDWYPKDKQGKLLFPVKEPKTIPERVFPSMSTILQGDLYANPAEQLPTKAHKSNFTLVARKVIQNGKWSPLQTSNSLSDSITVKFVDDVSPLMVNEIQLSKDASAMVISWTGGFRSGGSSVRVRVGLFEKQGSVLYEGFTTNLGEYSASTPSVTIQLGDVTSICGKNEGYQVRVMVESSRNELNQFSDGCTFFAVSPNALTVPKCGQPAVTTDTLQKGVLHGNGTSSQWLLAGDADTKVTLSFDYFNIEEAFSFVKVFDGESKDAPLIRTFTGKQIPFPVTSSSNLMFVVYETDKNMERSFTEGFRARFQDHEIPDLINSPQPLPLVWIITGSVAGAAVAVAIISSVMRRNGSGNPATHVESTAFVAEETKQGLPEHSVIDCNEL